MNTKKLVLLVTVVVLSGVVFLWWTAQKANEEREKIIDQFQRLDSMLNRSRDSIQQLNDSLLKNTRANTAE